ncbi:acetyltransferase [Croceibacterium mercuriale]|uniref:Acetyltransferase n=1 Tax=Croceibacterium mercuriale TaxID=1572751 RepID=A0A0B2BWK4_9SPHN|nr:GNAT family acetyltransferase [Croceibacterium mercuriale]KHL26023.1 acetyltransferase [Croceibacterium mercuriale]
MIRPALPADAATVIALWHACELTRPWNDPAADFARAIAGPTSTVLLLEHGGAAVGTVMAGYDGHRGWLYYIGVLPAYQRRGHARALVDAACQALAAQGCPKVELMVRHGNPAAALYARLGWERQPVETWALTL